MADSPIVRAVDFSRVENVELFDLLPDSCPRCHRSGTPNQFGSHAYVSPDKSLRIVLQCPNRACGHLFFAIYKLGYSSGTPTGEYGYHLARSEPWELARVNFSEYIGEVSKRFCSVFAQAMNAEHSSLDEIAGPGYRKALEILIKDFAKLSYAERLKKATKETDEADVREAEEHITAIESMLLVPCIKTYIDDKHIREVAERAAWLGNDETHYVRRWPEKDVKELKALLDLVIRFIDSDLEYRSVLADMPEGR